MRLGQDWVPMIKCLLIPRLGAYDLVSIDANVIMISWNMTSFQTQNHFDLQKSQKCFKSMSIHYTKKCIESNFTLSLMMNMMVLY